MKHIVLTTKPDGDLAAKWNRFLAKSPLATHYVTPNYFIDPYVRGERFAVLAVDHNDHVVAALTGVRAGEKLISGMFSRPQMVIRDDSDGGEAIQALLSGLKEFGGGDKIGLTEIYSWKAVPEFTRHGMRTGLSNGATSVVMIDLSVGHDAIFAGFSQTRRNELRKGLKIGLVEVKELETEGELTELYQINCEWNARKGNTADSFEQMKTAASQRENRRIFIAKADGRVIAGSFYRFSPGGTVEYAANNSRPEYQKMRPNDLIGWHAIQWACENGFKYFSMGGSHLFLRRFGGEIMTTYCYRQDLSRFRMHDLRENAVQIGLGAYRRLPENIRGGMKKILSR